MGKFRSEKALLLEIGKVMTRVSGVQLGEKQLSMMGARLAKRSAELGLTSVQQYHDYFSGHQEQELPFLISLLTTHHTYFFREIVHFEHLKGATLDALVKSVKARGENVLRVWSAACSRGQEVYSLAMWLQAELAHYPGMTFDILGSDIDAESVANAKNGVYPWKEVKGIPLHFLSKNWVRGTEEISEYAKAKDTLKKYCRFEVDNLITPKIVHPKKFDIIFCRNVFIYFTPEQIRAITENLLRSLQPNGFLYLGISETLYGLNLATKTEGPSIYVHATRPEIKPAVSTAAPKLIRVLCVDDSPTIHAVMKQILLEKHGFEIVGRAMNGVEAHRLVGELKPDILTLDIHMPEQTGIEYLENHFRAGHPPVVMMTSVSREDSGLATRALELGASDFVEKPTLSDMLSKGEEIRSKLQCAFQYRKSPGANLTVDRSFTKHTEIENSEEKLRVLAFSFSERAKLTPILKAWKESQPPILLGVEGSKDILSAYGKTLERQLGKSVTVLSNADVSTTNLHRSEIYLVSLIDLHGFKNRYSPKRTSILVFGQSTPPMEAAITQWKGAQVLLEDLGPTAEKSVLAPLATDTTPSTSFAYLSDEFLCKAA